MAFPQETLLGKLREAEQPTVRIRQLATDSQEQTMAILRWAVVGDETTKFMIQAEEQLSPAKLARLKAEINGGGPQDLWAKYRESAWRMHAFGGPGPGDEPPPTRSLKDCFP